MQGRGFNCTFVTAVHVCLHFIFYCTMSSDLPGQIYQDNEILNLEVRKAKSWRKDSWRDRQTDKLIQVYPPAPTSTLSCGGGGGVRGVYKRNQMESDMLACEVEMGWGKHTQTHTHTHTHVHRQTERERGAQQSAIGFTWLREEKWNTICKQKLSQWEGDDAGLTAHTCERIADCTLLKIFLVCYVALEPAYFLGQRQSVSHRVCQTNTHPKMTPWL